jgi:hypothetical protein
LSAGAVAQEWEATEVSGFVPSRKWKGLPKHLSEKAGGTGAAAKPRSSSTPPKSSQGGMFG